jgi:hypothetical protein
MITCAASRVARFSNEDQLRLPSECLGHVIVLMKEGHVRER